MTTIQLDAQTQSNVNKWLSGDYDTETKNQINKLLKENPQEIIDSFFKTLSFGTGGLRGVMGIGCNRINKYTVCAATQGLANYIKKNADTDHPSVIIGFDSRNNSPEFAKEAAKVLAGNNIKVYLFENLRPVPVVSFGCRLKKCQAAIIITASHNPPEYNGYKAYWADGAQVIAPHDKGIIEEVDKVTDLSQILCVDDKSDLIEMIEEEVDSKYFETIKKLQQYPEQNRKHGHELKLVYTALHGSGITMVPQTLENWGFKADIVEEQRLPDGDFPTVKSPNPEESDALDLAIQKMLSTNADIAIGTDPDCDRVGAVVNHHGKAVLLNGNQTAVICLEHICEALTKQNRMPENAAFIKTIVTTELFKTIAESYGKPSFDVLTGFKYIAGVIKEWDENHKHQYIFGAEESYGSLLGDHARDKDAVIASALIAEVALNAKLQGKTLIDMLNDMYDKYGVYREKLINLKFKEGKEGTEKMASLMKTLRNNPPKEFSGIKVNRFEDYEKGLKLPPSNVLQFFLEDQTKITVRPSGTEPKVKLYLEVVEKEYDTIEQGIEKADQKLDLLCQKLQEILG